MSFVGIGDEEILRCPKCQASLIKVLESRHTTGNVVSRRRQCHACDHIWGTLEVSLEDSAFCYMDRGSKRTDGQIRSEFGVKKRILDKIAALLTREC